MVFVAWPWVGWIRRRAAWGVGIAAALACVPIVAHQRRAAREMGMPIDIHTTIEYKTAKWLDAKMPGQRGVARGGKRGGLEGFARCTGPAAGYANARAHPEGRY